MINDYSKEFITIIQEIYNEQKNNMYFAVKGEMAALLYLKNGKDFTPKELSKHFNVSSARIASGLNSLESKGYVTRKINKEDRRQVLINITSKGIEVANKIAKERLCLINAIFEKMDTEDIKKGLELLKKLKTILNEIDYGNIEVE